VTGALLFGKVRAASFDSQVDATWENAARHVIFMRSRLPSWSRLPIAA